MYLKFKVITFGESNDGLWTSPRWFSYEVDARRFFNEIKYDPDVQGVYLTRETTTSWRVLAEHNTNGTRVFMTPQGAVKVQKAEDLALI